MKTTTQKQCSFQLNHSDLSLKNDGFKINKPSKTLDAEMQECFMKLKELVPSVPQNKKLSKVQILQHVIDYILDLEIALDTNPSVLSTATTLLQQQQPRQPLVETTQINAISQTQSDKSNSTSDVIISSSTAESLHHTSIIPC